MPDGLNEHAPAGSMKLDPTLAVPESHPIQSRHTPVRVSKAVALRAYEVYCHVFSPQEALITGGCRGGFSGGELIAFLYAHTFPREEWDIRFHQAVRGFQD